MAAMVEFAVILFLQRQNLVTKRNTVGGKGISLMRKSIEMDELAAIIDLMALILFSSGYIMFNVVYGQMYLI